MYIDTHCHLNFNAFKEDYKLAVERAFNRNVKGIINIGSNLETSIKAIDIAKEYKDSMIYAAVGLHPIHVEDEIFDMKKYSSLASNEKVVAIGETGIDLYHNKSTVNIQHDIFQKSLRIALQVNKPVIVHSRDGEEDLRAWLMGEQNIPRGVVHCFQGDKNFAEFMIDLGFLISFTGVITFTKNLKTIELIKEIPLEKIMIETDSPYLTPDPHRGERNEPVYVIEIAKKIAEIKKIPLSVVEEVTTNNAIELFNLK